MNIKSIEFPYAPPSWTPERRDFMSPAAVLPDAAGYVILPDKPGLGVDINWAALETLRIQTGTMA